MFSPSSEGIRLSSSPRMARSSASRRPEEEHSRRHRVATIRLPPLSSSNLSSTWARSLKKDIYTSILIHFCLIGREGACLQETWGGAFQETQGSYHQAPSTLIFKPLQDLGQEPEIHIYTSILIHFCLIGREGARLQETWGGAFQETQGSYHQVPSTLIFKPLQDLGQEPEIHINTSILIHFCLIGREGARLQETWGGAFQETQGSYHQAPSTLIFKPLQDLGQEPEKRHLHININQSLSYREGRSSASRRPEEEHSRRHRVATIRLPPLSSSNLSRTWARSLKKTFTHQY